MEFAKKLLFLFSILIISSCSKSKNDFLGEYSTYYTNHVKVANGITAMGSRVITIKTAMDVYLLNHVSVNLFIDESTKNLSGNGEIVFSSADNGIYPKLTRKRFDLELSDYQMKGDTLFFKMKSRIFNNKIDGYLIKDNDLTFLGIQNTLGDNNNYTASNPFYNNKNGKFNQYNTNVSDSDKQFNSFYEKQVDNNKSKISGNATEYEKEMYSTTNQYITTNYLK